MKASTRASVQQPRTLMMLSKCSLCPLARWEPQRGWARVRDAHLLWGGVGGKPFPSSTSTVCFLCARTSLGSCTEAGPGLFLLSLLNYITASAIRMYISVKLFPITGGIRLIWVFFWSSLCCGDQTTPSNNHSYFHRSSRVLRHGIMALEHLKNLQRFTVFTVFTSCSIYLKTISPFLL